MTRFGALAIFMAATPAFAATRAARAEAVALKPLSIVNRTDLEFGTLISSPVAGTVSINPTNDARTTTGNFYIDDTLLAQHGVTELDQYSVTPGTKDFIPDFFVD